jgi:hypothetical protein
MTVLQLPHEGERKQSVVWQCEGCGCVHVRAGTALLTFAPAEFAAFTESVNDCYWQGALTGFAGDESKGALLSGMPEVSVS